MRAVMAAYYSFLYDYFVYNYIFHPLYLARILGFHDFLLWTSIPSKQLGESDAQRRFSLITGEKLKR
jgi:hypothetical protein